MKKRTFTPVKLRMILAATLVLIVAINIGVFYLAYQQLGKMAVDTGQQVANARASQNTLQQLQSLKEELENNQEAIQKASRIAADGQNFTYQDQIVSDLTTYAARSGMIINNITFSTGAGAGSAAAPTAAPASPATPAPAGLKKTTISVTLKSPVNYRDLLNFLHYIEQNLTKLKVADITLTKGDDGTVNTDVLNLEVYLR